MSKFETIIQISKIIIALLVSYLIIRQLYDIKSLLSLLV